MNKVISNPKLSNWAVSPFCWYTILTSVLFGVIVLAILMYLNMAFRRNYVRGVANIVSEDCGEQYYNQESKSMKKVCTLNVSFNDITGNRIETTMHSPYDYKSNAKTIDITYDPINPHGTVENYFSLTIPNVILGFFLLMFFGNAIFFYIFRDSGWLCVASGAKMVFGKKHK